MLSNDPDQPIIRAPKQARVLDLVVPDIDCLPVTIDDLDTEATPLFHEAVAATGGER